MNIMVVGGGGREHAIIRKLKESKRVGTVFALPGNGGMGQEVRCVDIQATNLPGIVKFALDLPLIMGLLPRMILW